MPEELKGVRFTQRIKKLPDVRGDIKEVATLATFYRMRDDGIFDVLAHSVINNPLTYEELADKMHERFGATLPPLEKRPLKDDADPSEQVSRIQHKAKRRRSVVVGFSLALALLIGILFIPMMAEDDAERSGSAGDQSERDAASDNATGDGGTPDAESSAEPGEIERGEGGAERTDSGQRSDPVLNVEQAWPLLPNCDGATAVAMGSSEPKVEDFVSNVGKLPSFDREKAASEPEGGTWVKGWLMLVLSGPDESPVEVTSIRPQILQKDLSALAWIYSPKGGCGDSYYRKFVLDLDAYTIEDKGLVGNPDSYVDDENPPPDTPTGQPFFVTQKDTAQVAVEVVSEEGNYEWQLTISYVHDGEPGEVTLGPFRSMGLADSTTCYIGPPGEHPQEAGPVSGPAAKC